MESLLAETIICKLCGWEYGFLSGGIGVFEDHKLLELLKATNAILCEKVWINTGVLKASQIEFFKPHIKGVIGTVEVLDPSLHARICPSKPISAVEAMFEAARKAGVDVGMTLIVGLGETISDFELLKGFITHHNIKKIHIYGLNPQKGTIFEKTLAPTPEYQAEWIAKTRIAFPKIDIQCGIWLDRVSRVSLLLKAGANSISKFPAIRHFGGKEAMEIENQARLAGRVFRGTLTKTAFPSSEGLLEKVPKEYRKQVESKLSRYLAKMAKARICPAPEDLSLPF
jgi:biotin synthase-like enzyme